MRSLGFLALIVLASLGTYYVSAQEATPAPAVDQKLQTLMEQRLTARKQALEMASKLFDSGNVTMDVLYDAQAELTAAELEMTTDPAKQSEIHQRNIDWLKDMEARFSALHIRGYEGGENYWQAKAERIQAEIDMLREASN